MRWLILIIGLIACGGAGGRETSQNAESVKFPEEWPELNETLALEGKKLFMQKGCNACHTIGEGKLVGPDLKGLNKIVSYRWAAYMIMNPDSMIKYDDRARQLLKEYGIRMPNQKVKPKEAEAMLHYILMESLR